MVEFSVSVRQKIPLFIGMCVGISISLSLSNVSVVEEFKLCQDETSSLPIEATDVFEGSARDTLNVPEENAIIENYEDLSDYEPRINLAGKPHSAKKEPHAFNRPRYYSTELGIKEKIFVAVLSSINKIPSLGLAINQTLTHHVNRLAFFVETNQNEKLDLKTLPVIGFKDSQQGLLTLHTLKYLADKLAQGYSYFFLMKDTTYVNGRMLDRLVKHISKKEDVYMGTVAGETTTNPSVCSLDSGILMSSLVLQAVSPLLESCNDDYTFNSDDEKIGLCINRALKLNCQTTLQDQTFTTFNLDAHVNDVRQLEQIWEKESDLPRALTAFHARDPTYHYMLNQLSCATALKELELSIKESEKSILQLAPSSPGGLDSVSWPVGYSPASKAESRFSVLRWDFFNSTHIFFDTEHSVVRPLSRAHKEDVKEVIDAAVAQILNDHPRWKFIKLISGYKRFDPVRGMDYLIDLLFLHSSGTEITQMMEGCRPITHIDTVPMPYVTESSLVHILVPVWAEEQLDAADKLIRFFAKNMLSKSDKSELTLIVLTSKISQDGFGRLKSLAESLSSQYKKPGAAIHVTSYQRGSSTHLGLDFVAADLISNQLGPEALIFFCHPFTEMYPDVLNRVRINTISGWQLYSPIPFSEFNPEVSLAGLPPRKSGEILNISTNVGFYDMHDTWHISFYAADYLNARKTFETEMPIIKSERDEPAEKFNGPYESILSMFTRLHSLHVLRAVEPHLRLRYHHRRPCLTERCQKSLLLSQGTRSQLAQLALDMGSPTLVEQ